MYQHVHTTYSTYYTEYLHTIVNLLWNILMYNNVKIGSTYVDAVTRSRRNQLRST